MMPVTEIRQEKYSFIQRVDINEVVQHLRGRLRIAVIYGGNRHAEGAVIVPTRNPRSDKNYEMVAREIAGSLERLGFIDVAVLPEDMHLGESLRRHRTHFAWLNSGGTQGYASVCHAPALLELLGIPYVGHNPLNAAVLDNKHIFKCVLQRLGVFTPPFVVANYPFVTGRITECDDFKNVFNEEVDRFIVKPVSGRASQFVSVVKRDEIDARVEEVGRTVGNHVMVEEYFPGREFTVGTIGPMVARQGFLMNHGVPFVLPAVERILEKDEWIVTSMDIRPITLDRVRVLDADLDAHEISVLTNIALYMFEHMRLETAVRFDMRTDSKGRIGVLEANPKPDLKFPQGQQINLLAAGISKCGMGYDDLILSMLANRIDFLLRNRIESIGPIVDLLSES